GVVADWHAETFHQPFSRPATSAVAEKMNKFSDSLGPPSVRTNNFRQLIRKCLTLALPVQTSPTAHLHLHHHGGALHGEILKMTEVSAVPTCRRRAASGTGAYFRSHRRHHPTIAVCQTSPTANRECERETFTDQLPEIVCPHARRTQRIAELVHLIGHGTGGRPGERLMKRLGMPVSDDTILRHLKRQVARLRAKTTVRVAGIDDWSWRKGRTYGTIIVDLERREVVDVLQDRTTAGTAEWLRQHPEVEIVSRDRCGLYAQGAREGAPQARQVADRFHLLQNLRETIETQLSRADRSTGRALLPESNDEDPATIACGSGGRRDVAAHRHLTRQAHRRSRQAIFDQIHTLREAGTFIGDIARQTGCGRRSIRKS